MTAVMQSYTVYVPVASASPLLPPYMCWSFHFANNIITVKLNAYGHIILWYKQKKNLHKGSNKRVVNFIVFILQQSYCKNIEKLL